MNPYNTPQYEKGPDTSNNVELFMSVFCLSIYSFLFFVSAYYHNAPLAVISCILSSLFFTLIAGNLSRRYFR